MKNLFESFFSALVTLFVFVIIIFGIYITFFPGGRALINSYDNTMQKVDDRTKYETRKKVEDTARASIAAYKSDKSTYEMYKDSTDEEKKSWAEQAKMRANKTANVYNEYMLKNSYVFDGNIPSDINYQLEIIK